MQSSKLTVSTNLLTFAYLICNLDSCKSFKVNYFLVCLQVYHKNQADRNKSHKKMSGTERIQQNLSASNPGNQAIHGDK